MLKHFNEVFKESRKRRKLLGRKYAGVYSVLKEIISEFDKEWLPVEVRTTGKKMRNIFLLFESEPAKYDHLMEAYKETFFIVHAILCRTKKKGLLYNETLHWKLNQLLDEVLEVFEDTEEAFALKERLEKDDELQRLIKMTEEETRKLHKLNKI